ncbi:cupin domain-containing protein [Yinghuangia seranimata]|uniref:cupin domain-containing protein n=1 Tax=Yinghuangia seranimata TaxID=408067 RepID=UPI00248B4AAA|nr:cupin domain-containing protein [Yinghuangia seranimata]MDI2124947.1 cupin domain-containing protein [Yinghuangia seranimata]
MALIRTGDGERLTPETRPPGCRVSSAGRFRVAVDGTGRFDRHYHDFDEYWFVQSGTGTVRIGDVCYQVRPGDILFTKAGTAHDITAVTGSGDLEIFWLWWPGPPGVRVGKLHHPPADAVGHPVPFLPGDT